MTKTKFKRLATTALLVASFPIWLPLTCVCDRFAFWMMDMFILKGKDGKTEESKDV